MVVILLQFNFPTNVAAPTTEPDPTAVNNALTLELVAIMSIPTLGLGVTGIQNVNAGSVVVADGHNNLSTAYGGPVDREKQRAQFRQQHHPCFQVRITRS
jgi:hypothetical protein